MSLPPWLRSLLLFLLFGGTAVGGAVLGRDHLRPAARPDSLYRVAGQETVRQPQLHTAGDLFAALQQAAKTLLPADALSKVRAVIAAELREKLPTSPDAPLDAAARDRCAEQFARVAK